MGILNRLQIKDYMSERGVDMTYSKISDTVVSPCLKVTTSGLTK